MPKITLGTKFFRFFRSLDKYGHPIALTYKGDASYKTLIGGLLTIATRIGVIAFLMIEIMSVISKTSTITNSEVINNVAIDKNEYEFNSTMFDMAVRLNYNGP